MRRAAVSLLAVTVALVLADSAVVTLALPDILRHLDTTVGQVAWVLISFNLVLGVAAVPVAVVVARARPRALSAVGIAVFAGASAWCALAGSIEGLIAARCVQALGGALALVGCLELLVEERGERRGVTTWVTAGVIGTAAGPVMGGVLTEVFSWQAIFVVQVPFAVLAVPAALAVPAERRVAPDRHRPAVRANVTLALLSASLTAALFLLVLLLVEGWRRDPATAALTVSVVPLAALAARPLALLLRPGAGVEVAVGSFLVAGGLAGLAIPPSADLAWTVAPQALVGLGLGLTVDRLTTQAMELRLPRVEHAGWTIGARHLGVVLGLALLTPVFTGDLRDAEVPAQEAIASLVLDAELQPQDKIDLAEALGRELTSQRGRVPDLHRAFVSLDLEPEERAVAADLERRLDAQLERAATRAFRDSFLIGSGLALLALLTVVVRRPRRGAVREGWSGSGSGAPGLVSQSQTSPESPPVAVRQVGLPALAVVLVVAVLGVQRANDGGRFEPLHPADPCVERTVTSQADGIEALTERLVLMGIDGAACRLGISREALTLELARQAGGAGEPTDDEVEALRAGLLHAVDRMKQDGTLPPASDLVDEALETADLNDFLKAAIRALPDSVIDAALKTDDIVERTIRDLDIRRLLADLDDQSSLNDQVEAAVTQAVKDSLADRLRDLLP